MLDSVHPPGLLTGSALCSICSSFVVSSKNVNPTRVLRDFTVTNLHFSQKKKKNTVHLVVKPSRHQKMSVNRGVILYKNHVFETLDNSIINAALLWF